MKADKTSVEATLRVERQGRGTDYARVDGAWHFFDGSKEKVGPRVPVATDHLLYEIERLRALTTTTEVTP